MGDKNDEPLELKINCRSWIKNTEDLFDFETSNIKKSSYKYSNLEKDYYIIKYKVSEERESQKEKINFIFDNLLGKKLIENKTIKVAGEINFNKENSTIKIINSYKSKNFKYLYMPENCERLFELFPIEEYKKINQGDIIKFGRIRIKFDKINFEKKNDNQKGDINNIIPIYDENDDLLKSSNSIKTNYKEMNDTMIISINKMISSSVSITNQYSSREAEHCGKPTCRLCYQSECSMSDPLISPCNCSGSMKYIHLSCLKNSIKSKCHKESGSYYDIFLFKNYGCEICLAIYPKYIVYKTKIFNLIDLNLEKYNDYILCDLSQFNDSLEQKITPIGKLIFKIDEGAELSMGRKKNNDIKLKDISISRQHCKIMRKDDNLYIKDLFSKFGTMRYINNYIEIKNNNNSIKLLCGKHELEFSLVKSWSLFGVSKIFNFACCTCNHNINETSEIIIYNTENNEGVRRKDKKKYSYYNKFKDYDSYNDYIIEIKNIICQDIQNQERGSNGNEIEINSNFSIKEK
jgi:hypothetical protein